MENQHNLIKGYRDLSEEEIAMMNAIKKKAAEVQTLIADIENQYNVGLEPDIELKPDARWLAIARTDLQKGFMALVRSVAKPEGF